MFGRTRQTDKVLGLALSGGGSRGAWQVGGLRALNKHGIMPSLISGCSAGAINAAWYALQPHKIDELESIWLSLRQRDVFPGNPLTVLRNFLYRGYLHSSGELERLLRRHVGPARFEDCAIPLSIVAVRLSDGQRVVFDSGELVPAVMASAAIPGVFPPYAIDGELYVDGGVLDFLPLNSLWERGASAVYAFDCSYFEPRSGGSPTVDRAARIASQFGVDRDVALDRAAGRSIVLFRPELPEDLDSRDFSMTAELIQRGYAYVGRALDEQAGADHDHPGRRAG